MLITMTLATALGGPVRHLIRVDVPVVIPIASQKTPAPAEPILEELAGVRVTRWVPATGEVELSCDGPAISEDPDSPPTHQSRLFVRDGVLWLEVQAPDWPAAVTEWSDLGCAYESNGRRVEWTVRWVAHPPDPISDPQ